MGVIPRQDDLQCSIQGDQGHVVADEGPTPDRCVDTLHDDTELIDAGWDACIDLGRSVPPGNQDLKGLPSGLNGLVS
jgi:hypothetical protein